MIVRPNQILFSSLEVQKTFNQIYEMLDERVKYLSIMVYPTYDKAAIIAVDPAVMAYRAALQVLINNCENAVRMG